MFKRLFRRRRSGPVRRRVLVVDDQPDIATMTGYLYGAGYEVVEVYDGQTALEEVAASPPDVIMMDEKLPDVSGWDVLERLQAAPETRGVLVLMLVGRNGCWNVAPEDVPPGVSAALAKPVERRDLRRFVKRLLAEKQRRAQSEDRVALSPAGGEEAGGVVGE